MISQNGLKNNMGKVLFLSSVSSVGDEYFKKQRNRVVSLDNYNIVDGGIIGRKFFLGLGFFFFSPIQYLLYGEWKKRINEYDIIFLESRRSSKYAIQWLGKQKDKRIIVWYWNTVTREEIKPSFAQKNNCETWSFDIADCKKYNMNFSDQYCLIPNELCGNAMADKLSDVYYLGKWTLERYIKVEEMRRIFTDFGLSFTDHLVKTKEDWIDYERYLEELTSYRCLLEINQRGQSGLTLRALEALFLKKKLITNNREIVSSKIYDKDNIFIVGKDDLEHLKEFVLTDFIDKPVHADLRRYYSFESWVRRIIEEKT